MKHMKGDKLPIARTVRLDRRDDAVAALPTSWDEDDAGY
jgi:hypothetical protein